jgi:hypothetical protein
MNTYRATTIPSLVLATLLSMGFSSRALAQQDFTLFEPVETNDSQAVTPEARVARENRNSNGSPEFTLLGTSRIGDKVTAMLQHRDGKTVMVSSDADGSAIEGYPDYIISGIAAGQVTITYPGGSPCMSYSDQGVHCNASGNAGELTLPNKAPLAPRTQDPAAAEAATLELANGVTEEVVPDPNNPFAALQAAAARQRGGRDGARDGGDAATRAFQTRRIDPADVPPGMRIVSTPFGDRLVEDN